MRHLFRLCFAGILSSIATGCVSHGDATPVSTGGSSTAPPVIQPMSVVNVSAGTGYFQVPSPIRVGSPLLPGALPAFVGTTHKLFTSGQTVIAPDCFAASAAVSLDTSPMNQPAAQAGSKIDLVEGLNIYKNNSGGWHLTATVQLVSLADPTQKWGVIMHGSPAGASSGVPTQWVADAVLVGDLGKKAPDNYGGKFFEDSGVLYLVYSAYIGPNLDGLVAQKMLSPTQVASSAPVTILAPSTSNGGYNSELATGGATSSPVRLMEGGQILKINGKYVLTYSDGVFNRSDYKSGIAYCDQFLPKSGEQYRRVLANDAAGVWGQANHDEVLYLLQSQIAQWPNYVATQVLAPGVPAIISDTSGAYYLAFAGYDPSDTDPNASGLYNGAHRRPYYVKLQVQIPTSGSVATTSDASLATWVQLSTTP